MVEPRSERGRARVWLEREVAAMRDAGLPPQRVAQSERVLRAQLEVLVQPVEPYVGLTLEEARQRARGEHRVLVVRDEAATGRWDPAQVLVALDDEGRVRTAARPAAPWDR